MLQHRWRTLTVLLGIALGAAVFTSVRLSIDASLNSFVNSIDRIAGQTHVSIMRPGGRVPETLLPHLLADPAIQSASPVLSTYVQPEHPSADSSLDHASRPFLLIGLAPLLDRGFRNWETGETTNRRDHWFHLIKQPFSIMIGDALARENGWRAESEVLLTHTRQTAAFQVLDILKPDGLALVEGGRVAMTDIATFQEFTGLQGKVDRIDLIFQPSFRKTGAAHVRSILPEGLILTAPSDQRESGQEMIRAYQLNLSVLSFVSLFVGMFLVYSLVALNAASRRKELAVLRSLGASQRMIFLLFLSEGMFLGIIGWLLAMPISTILVKFLLHGIGQTISTLFVRVQVDRLWIQPWEFMLSFGITLIISFLASWQPAREAMRVSPREALMISSFRGDHNHLAVKLMVSGGLLVISVWPVSGLQPVSDFPVWGYIATFFLFVGFSLMTPYLLRQVGAVAAPLLRKIAGEPAYLAGRYVRDSGIRTAISVGALITAVALFVALAIMVYSFRNTVETWVCQTISGDVFVTARLANTNQHRDPLSPQVVESLKQMDVPADMLPFRRIYLGMGKTQYQLEALDFAVFDQYGRFSWLKGRPETVMPLLIQGEGCVVSEVFSRRNGLTVGDIHEERIDNVLLRLPILGIVRDYRPRGGVVFYDLGALNAQIPSSIWTGVRFFIHDDVPNPEQAAFDLQEKIIQCTGDPLDIILGRELRRVILQIFDETFAVTGVLLLIALIVAALGITSTLTVQVLERSTQLNTIFAIGGSRLQIRAMIFWEAALMVVVGQIAGLICGFMLSYLLVFVINYQSFGWTFHYAVNWPVLFLSLPLIVMTAIFSSFPAMRVIFRMSPADILRVR